MAKLPKRPQVYRICAVCGKRHGVTYGFRNILARNGIKGDKATLECIKSLGTRKIDVKPTK